MLPIAPRQRWWAWALAGVGALLVAVVAVSSLLPADLVADRVDERTGTVEPTPYAQVPAATEAVADRIVFGDLPDEVGRFDSDGDVLFVTVSAPSQSLLSWFVGRDDPAIDFLTEEDKFGTRTPTQRREFNLQAMRTAEQEAQYVALTAVGYDADISAGDVIVQEVLCVEAADDGTCAESYPADEQIDPADRIIEVDGEAIGSVEDLSALLAERKPGDTVELVIERPGEGELTVDVELSAAPDDPDRTIIGFVPFDTRTVELPFEVDIETAQIGGPSAGLAFTLSLIDELTPGELTGGRDVAVTGTIGLDGTVGPIGSLYQKANAVHQHGIEHFIVPASQSELQSEESRRRLEEAGRGDVEIIPVADLDEALAALELLGGDPVAPVDG